MKKRTVLTILLAMVFALSFCSDGGCRGKRKMPALTVANAPNGRLHAV